MFTYFSRIFETFTLYPKDHRPKKLENTNISVNKNCLGAVHPNDVKDLIVTYLDCSPQLIANMQ